MAVHQAGSESIEVSPRSRNFFFYRRMGVRIEVSPRRKWYCLWLCSKTTKIDSISCDAVLQGLDGTAQISDSCTNCGSLNVMGKKFWGIYVPKPYDAGRYSGVVVVEGVRYPIEGSFVYS